MNKQEQLKPNSLETANKSVEKYEGVKLPTTINANENHLYHVAIVESIVNREKLKFDNKLRIQKFNDRAWLRIEKNLKRIGVENAFIFHNPKLNKEEVKEVVNTKVSNYDSVKEEAIELGFVDGGKKATLKQLNDFIAKAKANSKEVDAPAKEEEKEGGEGKPKK